MSPEKQTKISILSVLARPREGKEFERRRRYLNCRLKEVLKIRQEHEKENNTPPILFLYLDWVIKADVFGNDMVHLNSFGNQQMGRRLSLRVSND